MSDNHATFGVQCPDCDGSGNVSIHSEGPGFRIRHSIACSRCDGLGVITKLWLWRNFVDGKQEYWAFDNPYPVFLDSDDPQTLGEPCGYAILKSSRASRKKTAP